MLRLLFLTAALVALTTTPAEAQGCNIGGGFTINQSTQRADPGDTFTISYTFGIDGGCPAFEVAHYIWTDRYRSPDDVLVGTTTLPASGPQTNVGGSGEITVPDLPRGGYRILVVAHPDDSIPEDFQSDNVSFGRLTVGGGFNGPDLAIAEAELEDDTAAPGDRVSFEYSIINQGNADVDDVVTGFHLRPINAPPSEWIFLESEVAGNVEAGETEDESEQVTIPSSTIPQEYALLVVADDGNAIEESNETNNVLGAGRIEITSTVPAEGAADGAALSLAVSPNPSAGMLSLRYTLASPSAVRLAVFDALGRGVAVVQKERRGAGA